MTAWSSRQNAIGTPALARRRLGRGLRALTLVSAAVAWMFAVAPDAGARAEAPVRGEVRVSTDDGYTRLVFRLEQHVPAEVRLSWPIVVIAFKQPVDIPVERLSARAPDIISAARLDPDGTAIRIALANKVKINTIPAAERLYVDLLPENWTGVLPGLPREVVEELAQRARTAEQKLHRQRIVEKNRTPPLIRVRVATQPTFTRYVFTMPETVNAVPEQAKGKLTLHFDQPIRWDLADALVSMPSTLRTVKADPKEDSTDVSFVLKGTPEVRTFREDNSLVVDIGRDIANPKDLLSRIAVKADAAADPAAGDAPEVAPPATVPADAPAAQEQPPEKDDLPPLIDVPAPSADQPQAQSTAKPRAKLAHSAPQAAATPKPAAPASKAAPPAAAAPAKMPAAVTMPSSPRPMSKPQAAAKPSVSPSAETPSLAAAMIAAAPKGPSAPHEATPPAGPPPKPNGTVKVDVHQDGDALRLEFPFVVATPAAAFRRADTLWLVFDTEAKIDLAALSSRGVAVVRSAAVGRGADGEAIVRIRLKRPQLASLDNDGTAWTVAIGDGVTVPTQPLNVVRSVVGRNHANIVIPFAEPAKLHRITDPDIGDRLLVVTGLGPARGFLRPRDYVELGTLASIHGVVVRMIADDVTAELGADKITLTRPKGLSLSSALVAEPDAASGFRSMTFDTQLWGFDRRAEFQERQSELIRRAAAAPQSKRRHARLNLARFYLARRLSAEAKAVLDVALADHGGMDDVTGSVLKAVADIMLRRPEDALKQLSKPQVGTQLDAAVWRAIALSRQGSWSEAREAFKKAGAAVAALPIELQRVAMMEELRTDLELRDFNSAARLVSEFETLGVPPTIAPSFAVLVGRLDEGLGRTEDALDSYHQAVESSDRRAAAQGRLHEIALRASLGEVPRKQTINALETLTTVWRGDETETEGLKLLAHLYTEEGRYRDAFHVMRTALLAHPNSDLTRKIHDEAAATFESLFLSNKGDALPPIEALALFYDYRELTPIGRRGDEMIRRLADRLVAVDLLDQAAELLQHQVDERLQGAARAQVATRLAVIYLMSHKPDRALASLRATRSADLANDLRDQRLLLEARALSDIGRHDLALEVIANIKGREADRLRADILWDAKRWREAAEQIERLYGDRWQQFAPLDASERADILRAAIGYALADEAIGLARFRDKYGPKMAEGPDSRAFDVVSAPIGTANSEFQSVARRVAAINTLDAFLRDMRKRYPETGAASADAKDAATPAGKMPTTAKPGAAAPAGTPKIDAAVPTGSIAGVRVSSAPHR